MPVFRIICSVEGNKDTLKKRHRKVKKGEHRGMRVYGFELSIYSKKVFASKGVSKFTDMNKLGSL